MKQSWCRDGGAGPLSGIWQREMAVPCPGTWEGPATRPATPEQLCMAAGQGTALRALLQRAGAGIPSGKDSTVLSGTPGAGGMCPTGPPSMRGPASSVPQPQAATGSLLWKSLSGAWTGGTVHMAGLCSSPGPSSPGASSPAQPGDGMGQQLLHRAGGSCLPSSSLCGTGRHLPRVPVERIPTAALGDREGEGSPCLPGEEEGSCLLPPPCRSPPGWAQCSELREGLPWQGQDSWAPVGAGEEGTVAGVAPPVLCQLSQRWMEPALQPGVSN